MSKKAWICWAIVLLLPGAVGLSIYCAQKNARQNRIAQAAQADTRDADGSEYLQMYAQWSNLPAEEKANNPWGYNRYGGSDIQNRLKEGQTSRLLGDLPELAKGMTHYPDELVEVLYGPGWQQEVENYKKSLNTAEVTLIGSTSLLAGGGLIVAGGVIKLLISGLFRKSRSKDDDSQPQTPSADIGTKQEYLKKDASETDAAQETVHEETVEKDSSARADLPKDADCLSPSPAEMPTSERSETPYARKNRKRASKAKNEGYFQTLRKAGASEESAGPSDENKNKTDTPSALPLPSLSSKPKSDKPSRDSYFGWAVEMDAASPLEALMTSEPLTKELTELTEEVSAIRQFAAQQQDQVRKLQDGYDWMIIRRFCLRIIRSIDNIEDRIVQLNNEQKDAAMYLEDIRDELVFALESSGIEQFEPDVNVPFKGLEKYAEAVRQRIGTEDTNLVGCIARVVRPGYQYLVNDDNVKIVRCAQVNLYEAKQSEQE